MDMWMVMVVAAVAMVAAGTLVWAFMQYGLVRPLQKNVRALGASCDDMGWLMGQQRQEYREQVGVLEQRVRDERASADTFSMLAELATSAARVVVRERDEARAASQLALTFYGKALERAA